MESLKKIFRLSRGARRPKPAVISKREELREEIVKSIVAPAGPVQIAERDPSWRIIESYYIYKPFVKIVIAETDTGPRYFVEEYGLTPADNEVLKKLTQILIDEIKPPTRPEDIKDLKGYVFREAERIAEKYKNKLGLIGSRRIKLLYYIERNLLGYGPIDPLLKDPNIEDISCNGIGIPIYVWHKKYESIPTNITFVEEDYLNEFIMKMAHMAGKHISIAFPILDAMLPEKHRLAATFGREVSVKGPSFTIRKFRERPFSVTEIIKSGEINSLVAAYIWTLIEHGKTAMIAGGTGTGKSFPGDTLIPILVNGRPAITRAKDLYSLVNSREYRVGEHYVKDVDGDIRILSVGRDYRIGWRRVRKVIRHRDNRPLVRVVTDSSIITTTIDHNFIKIDPETMELIPVRAGELREGDWIVNSWLDLEYMGGELSLDEAVFLGIWIGAGYLMEDGVIGLKHRSKPLVEKYRFLVRKLYSTDPRVKLEGRYYRVEFTNYKLFNELRELVENKDSIPVIINRIIFAKDKSYIIGFMAGLTETSSSIIIDNHNGEIKAQIIYSFESKHLLNLVSYLLKRLRIKHRVSVEGEVYKVAVKEPYMLKLLEYMMEYFTTSEMREFVSKIKDMISRFSGREDKDSEASQLYREKDGIGLSMLAKLADTDILLEEVKSIEYVDPSNDFLYDLEVEDTHNFVIGQIGWRLNHNTTLLNVVSMFIRPGMKIVTIEDTPEINLPHPNWVQLTSRESYLVGSQAAGTNIRLFDLVKLSLRYRPDYIIVGEIRGEEAFVLFQAMASVSHDTPVLLKDDAGHISLVKIGEFIDKFYNVGEERIAKPVEGYYVLSHNGYNAVWKPVKYVLRHSTDEIYEIEYEGGGRLEATGSHSVFVLDPDTLDIVEKPVSLLGSGDYLVSFNGVERDEDYQEINVVKLVMDYDDVYVDNIPEEIKKYTNGKNPIPLQKYTVLKSKAMVDDSDLRIKLLRSKYSLPPMLVLDEDLAYVFGAYTAYGCVKEYKEKRICFAFSKGEEEIASRVLDIIERKFNIKPTINDRGTHVIYEFNHTLLATVFEKLLGRKPGEKKIPEILWRSPVNVVRSFFEGLKADQRRTHRGSYASYSTANKDLAYQLLWLARYKGLYSELVVKHAGKDRGGTYYNVLVYLDENLRKINASERIPVKPLIRLIKLSKPRSIPYELTRIREREFISRRTAREVLEWIKKNGTFTDTSRSYMKKIKELIESNLTIHKVKNIRKKTYHGYVYDISVPETESFYGGNIPILLHNTGHGGLSTLHAETLDYAIKRLTSPPMNISPPYIKLMNIFIHLKRVITRIEKGVIRVERRVTTVQEVADYGKYIEIAHWDPKTDQFKVRFEDSIHLRDIADKRGLDLEDIIDEIYRKATVLNWMILKNIFNVWDVSRIIFDYYYDPATVYKRAVEELEEAGREAAIPAITTTREEIGETEELVTGTKEMGEATKELFERTRELGK